MATELPLLAEKLKKSYSKKDFDALYEMWMDSSDEHMSHLQNTNIFNGHTDDFYEELSYHFVTDLNEAPLTYFEMWEPIIGSFHQSTKELFLQKTLENSTEGDAGDYVQGMIYLTEGQFEFALIRFNRIDNAVAAYFTGICYLELENYENAIINYNFFLESIDKLFINEPNSKSPSLLVVQRNTLSDLGYLNLMTQDFKTAKINYQRSLEIFNLDDTYSILNLDLDRDTDPALDWLRNYFLSLEKTHSFDESVALLEFITSKRPENSYFKQKLISYKETANADEISENSQIIVYKRKKPFDVENYVSLKLISKEKQLEDMILEQIKYGHKVFGKKLELYRDGSIHGRQYYISSVNGFLDLLLIDKENDQLYVVELKRDKAGVEVVEQIEKYMRGLKEGLKRDVKGIICLHRHEPDLSKLVENKKDIELYTYKFDFEKIA